MLATLDSSYYAGNYAENVDERPTYCGSNGCFYKPITNFAYNDWTNSEAEMTDGTWYSLENIPARGASPCKQRSTDPRRPHRVRLHDDDRHLVPGTMTLIGRAAESPTGTTIRPRLVVLAATCTILIISTGCRPVAASTSPGPTYSSSRVTSSMTTHTGTPRPTTPATGCDSTTSQLPYNRPAQHISPAPATPPASPP